MKKSLPILSLAILSSIISFYSCKKENIDSNSNLLFSKGSVDYTNPNPTWIQVKEPILMPAKWAAQFVPSGFAPGLPTPNYQSTQGRVIVPDTTIIVKWHLHVGLVNSNTTFKPDVIDYRHFFINGVDLYKKINPNGGVQGDYDFIDTIKIVKNGYYNSYFSPVAGYDSTFLKYNWNGITPEVHSKPTNGWINSSFFAGIPIQ